MKSSRWISIDAAKYVSGYALWEGENLVAAGTVEKIPRSKEPSDRWAVTNNLGDEPSIKKFPKKKDAWRSLLPVDFVIMEAVHVGNNRNTAIALGEEQGKILAYLEWDEATKSKLLKPAPSQWRKSCSDALGVKWPKGREQKKVKAQEIVYDRWLVDAGPDAADAILIGFWHVTLDKKQRSSRRGKRT